MTTPLLLHAAPAAGFEQPFEMLLACHERVERMLALMERLAQHLPVHGSDAQAGQAALDVMRYFDRAGPAHHEDEERHVLPALRASGDVAAAALADRLQHEHAEMARQWRGVRDDLATIAAGGLPAPGAATRRGAFAALYRAHIVAEEGLAYPAVSARLGAAALAAMGREMAQRRGLP